MLDLPDGVGQPGLAAGEQGDARALACEPSCVLETDAAARTR
jgi:hypothetical protein